MEDEILLPEEATDGAPAEEISAEEMDARAQVFVSLKTKDMISAKAVLTGKYADVRSDGDYIRVYDVENTAEVVDTLMKSGHVVSELKKNKIGLEEYYIELMSAKEEK